MYTEYVFENREYDVALRDVKSILFDIVMSEQTKVTAIIGKVQSTGDQKLQEELINLCNEQGECLHSILEISNSFKEHLQKLDSYSRELKRIEKKNMVNIITKMRKKEGKRDASPVESQDSSLMEELNKKQKELEAKQLELIEREKEAQRILSEAEAKSAQQSSVIEQPEVVEESVADVLPKATVQEETPVVEETKEMPDEEIAEIANTPVEEKTTEEEPAVEETKEIPDEETEEIANPPVEEKPAEPVTTESRDANPTEAGSSEIDKDTLATAEALGIKLPENILGGPIKFVSSATPEGESEETKEEEKEETVEEKTEETPEKTDEETAEIANPTVEETPTEETGEPVIQTVEEVSSEEPVIETTEEVVEDKEEVTEDTEEPVVEEISGPVIPVEETTEENPEEQKDVMNTTSEPVIPPVIETTEEVVEDTEEVAESTEENGGPVIPIVEIAEENTENTDTDSSVVIPVAEDSAEEQPVQAEETEEQVIKFKKDTQDQTKAILTSAVQIEKLRNSRFSQEAILNTKGFFGTNIDAVVVPQVDIPAAEDVTEQPEATTENKEELEQQLMDNNLLPNDVDSIQNQINEKMEQAKQFYEEGKTEEAQKLYEDISELNKQLQATQQKDPTLVKAA